MWKRKSRKIEIKPIGDARPYVLWRRVSTQEQEASGLGLEAQLTIAKMFMAKDPVEVFTDIHSGTKLKECGQLWEAIRYCKENDYVLCIAKSDRLRSVSEALDIIDSMGERNVVICDLPTCDRFVLTIMFAVWERQAQMIQINTRLALAERQRQIAENGGFFSKSGHWVKKLGNPRGYMPRQAIVAANEATAAKAVEWRKESPLFAWVELQVFKHRARVDILADAQELYRKHPEKYGTRNGCPLSKGILSKWIKIIQLSND